MDGYGVYRWLDGSRYEGFFRAGKQHGKGTLYRKDGTAKQGHWVEGKRQN